MITKRYKIGSFYEYLNVRKLVWNIQFIVLVLALVIGFPSTILTKIRDKLEYDETKPSHRYYGYPEKPIENNAWLA